MPNVPKSALDRIAKSTLWTERHSGVGRGPGRSKTVDQGVPFWRFAKLTEPLSYGSSADALVRVRNSGDTGYEDGTEHFEVYPSDQMDSGDEDIATGTIVRIKFLCDPRWPHWVAFPESTGTSLEIRRFVLRTDLEPGGAAIAQWMEFTDLGVEQGSACEVSKRLCWKYDDNGDPIYFWVFDSLNELWGYKDRTCGIAWQLPDTPTPQEMCLDDAELGLTVNDDVLFETNRMVCTTFTGCPCQDPDVDPCEEPGS